MYSKLKRKIYDFDFKEFFNSIFWAILIAIIFRTFLFEPFKIPSGSMIPTLVEGDYIFVSKYSYGFSRYSFPFGLAPLEGRVLASEPKRGDIIVFKGVRDPDVFYIKRLVGLPGDKVQMKKGDLYINGEAIPRDYIDDYIRKGHYGESIRFKRYNEKINGKSYNIILDMMKNQLNFPDSTEEYLVPSKHYFFMGDNRNNSGDSRILNVIGYVPEDRIVGKAQVIFWSNDFSRVFKFIED